MFITSVHTSQASNCENAHYFSLIAFSGHKSVFLAKMAGQKCWGNNFPLKAGLSDYEEMVHKYSSSLVTWVG